MKPAVLLSLILAALLGVLPLSAGSRAEAQEKKAEIVYVEWASATAASHVVKAVLEEKMGYECTLRKVSAPGLWQNTAAGRADAFVCAWLPSLHRDYYAKAGDNVEDLGPNLEGTKVGLVVPEYVTIDSIEQINDHAEKFDNRIIGIDPGAGIMAAAEDAIEAYGMDEMKLSEGSGALMTEILAEKTKNRQWVVVTGWNPHWKFAKWDLKYLEDPKDVFGGAEAIHTVARRGLKEENPEIYAFLDNFRWENEDINQVMAMIRKNDSPYKSAVKWVEENPEKVEAWLP